MIALQILRCLPRRPLDRAPRARLWNRIYTVTHASEFMTLLFV